jgi:hypothetical protein
MEFQDLSKMPVQVNPCKTCPFEGSRRSILSPESQARYTQKILNLESQHLCHSVNNTMLCRGGRTLLLKVLTVLGAIEEPSDRAFDEARDWALGLSSEIHEEEA